MTGWQLLIGGIVLLPIALLVDPPLHNITPLQVAGYVWLCVLERCWRMDYGFAVSADYRRWRYRQ